MKGQKGEMAKFAKKRKVVSRTLQGFGKLKKALPT